MVALKRSVQVASVVMLSVFWGLNWPVMKISLTVVEPWTLRAVLMVGGGVGCLLVALLFRQPLAVPRAQWRPMLWVGFFQGLLWNGLSGFGLAMVAAGRAAVLAFTMPIWATLLALIFLKEPVSLRRLIGLALGMAGMALLIWPALGSLNDAALGTFLMLGAAIAWGIATVIVRGVKWEVSPLTIGGWQLLIGAGPIVAAAILFGKPSTLLDVDLVTGGGIVFSVLLPMIVCQAIFFTIVRELPASLASMSTLMVPPLGVFFSALLINEKVGLLEIAALVLVVAAMLFTMPGFSWRAIRRRPPASFPG